MEQYHWKAAHSLPQEPEDASGSDSSEEEDNIKILSENINLSEKEKIEIKSLKRGECLMFVEDEHILVKIESSENEKKVVLKDNCD